MNGPSFVLLARRSKRTHRRDFRDDSGFTLIEVMIALLLVFIALLSLSYVVTRSMSYVGFARQR